MEIYRNLGGYSGISTYEFGPDSITVWYKDGSHFVFTTAETGENHIDEMKILAKEGCGLNSYINDRIGKGAPGL